MEQKEFQKEFTEEQWSKKKIVITVLILASLLSGVYVFYQNNKPTQEQVAGVQDNGSKNRERVQFSIPSSSSIQSGIKDKVNNLKEQVNDLNAVEIASSSPQVQKILRDIKDLEQYPHSQAKEACQKICNNF